MGRSSQTPLRLLFFRHLIICDNHCTVHLIAVLVFIYYTISARQFHLPPVDNSISKVSIFVCYTLCVKKKVSKKTRRKKLRPIKLLKKDLWELCKQLVRIRDGSTCFTCNKTLVHGSDKHTGHCIPSSVCGLFLRYDLRNLAVQCYDCNINKGGMGFIFGSKLTALYGHEFAKELEDDRRVIIENEREFLEETIAIYKTLLDRRVEEWKGMPLFPDEFTRITRSTYVT